MSEHRDVVRRIQSAELSPSQQRVTRFLLSGGLDVIHFTIAQIAEAVGVNASTVVRTAQALGYPGFPEFQEALRSQLLRQARLSQRLQVAPDTPTKHDEDGERHILDRVLHEEIQHMLDLPEHIAYDTFDTAVDIIDKAQHVYVIGLGASFPIALNLGIIMRFVRHNVIVLKPGIDPIASQLTDMEPEDVLVAVCFSRYMRETLTTMEYAKRQHVPVIAITDSLISPPAKRATLSLTIPHRFRLYGNAVAVFALTDALVGSLFQRYPERTRKRLDHLEELYQAFHILSDEDEP